jgi:hypothetical protein
MFLGSKKYKQNMNFFSFRMSSFSFDKSVLCTLGLLRFLFFFIRYQASCKAFHKLVTLILICVSVIHQVHSTRVLWVTNQEIMMAILRLQLSLFHLSLTQCFIGSSKLLRISQFFFVCLCFIFFYICLLLYLRLVPMTTPYKRRPKGTAIADLQQEKTV